jgi:lincosamide nucleotidyltransferase A/C/D/E
MPDMRGNARVAHWLRHRAVRAARAAYLGLERTRLTPFLDLPPVRRLKAQVTHTPAARVLEVLDLLAPTGVSVWIAGGWGVDALLGRQTRRHSDLDLVISDSDEEYLKVADVLQREGFHPDEPELTPGLAMPLRCAWRHDKGHSLEIMPVALQAPPFKAALAGARTSADGSPFTNGRISGRTVPCVSAGLQFTLHEEYGYPLRDIDEADLGLLHAYIHGTERTMPT